MPDDQHPLEPAEALAPRNPIHQLGESEEYRAARQRLLVREYELRRLTESVAAERRALPPGAEVTREYRFEGEKGAVKLPTCSAAMTPSSFTATCSVRSARRHVRCARAS